MPLTDQSSARQKDTAGRAGDSSAPLASASGDPVATKGIALPMKRSVLMARPNYFAGLSARSGGPAAARPKAFQGRSNVDLALKQWHTLVETLKALGVDVLAAQPDRAVPDLALVGLTGFLADRSARRVVGDKTFIVSSLDPRQQPLHEAFARTIRSLGFRTEVLDYRFGGSGDFFRCGRNYVYVCGPEEIDDREPTGARKFLAMLGSRSSPFSTDPRLRETLAELVPGSEVFQFTLCDPRFCRGDMVACAVGEDRKVLMIYVKAINDDAQRLILGRKARVSETVIPMSEADAAMYAAGCLQFPPKKPGERPIVVLPMGVSSDLTGRLDRAGCDCVPVDISEWIKKDRGGLASMVLDLGYLRDDRRTQTTEVQDVRVAMRQGLDKPPTAG